MKTMIFLKMVKITEVKKICSFPAVSIKAYQKQKKCSPGNSAPKSIRESEVR
jgi:hypothetical protein